jgi:hypothetical protein
MFDPLPLSQKSRQLGVSTMAPAIPTITINMPESAYAAPPHANLCHSHSPAIASDPVKYINKPWSSLSDFLSQMTSNDCHGHDFTMYKQALSREEILGLDDLAKCTVEELHSTCTIPMGSAKLLAEEGKCINDKFKAEAKACKHQHIA